MKRRLGFVVFASALVLSTVEVWAIAANVWHIPDNATDLGGTHMRNPWLEISNNPASPTTVTICEGIYNGSGTEATWTDNGSQTGISPANVARFYKVAVRLG